MAARKLIHKLTVLAIVPVILSMVVFGSISYSLFKEKLIQERIEEAKSLIDLSSAEIRNPLYFLELNKLNDIVQNIKKNPNVLSVYIMDSNGRIITDGTPENKFYNQILNDELSKKSIQSNELLYEIKKDVLQVSAPAIINEKIGTIRIDFSLKELDQILINLITFLIVIGTIILIGVAVVDIFISRSISKPIARLGTAAGEIAKGNFDTRIETRSDDEIGELAAAFNKMAQDLQKSSNERQRSEDRLTKLNECFLGFGTKPVENINRLTVLCGELMGASCALYNRLDQGLLCSWGRWNTPPDYNPVDKPEGHICYDTINRGSDEILVVQNLPETGYAHTDPNVMAYKLRTYIGTAVKLGDNYVGSLCVVYQDDYLPSEDDKRLMGVIASAIGIEETRKHAEGELLKFKLGIERSDEAIFITNIDGTISYVNPAFEKIYGFSREEALGKTPRILKSGLLPSEAYKPFWDTLLAKKVVNGELTNKTRDGRLLNIDGTANPILNDDENIIGFLAIQHDITERKRIEEELKIKAQLLDTATDSIFVHDTDGNFIYLNEAAYKSRGYTRDELMRMNLRSIVTPQSGKLINQHTKEMMEKGEFIFESADVCKNKSIIPVEVHARIIESGGKKLILSVARDITEHKKAEELLKEKARAELYGFIVSALPVFASGVPSHVRNILVKNFAERFEKNIRPRFEDEMKRLGYGQKVDGDSIEHSQEVLDEYILWLQGLFSNFGIRSRTTSRGTNIELEFLNCPWIGEAKGNPVFCFICRTIVIRSFTWTALKGNADQSTSIAYGSKTCKFEIHT